MNDRILRPWEEDRSNFDRNLAVVIGIDRYDNHPNICNLSTPVSDARAIAELLKTRYDYKEENMICLFSPHRNDPNCNNLTQNYPAATLDQIKTILTEKLPNQLKPTQADRVIFYYAGHGIPRSSLDGPAGSLVPQDAEPNKLDSYLSMQYLFDRLNELACHHLLLILDCCYAGTFQWVCRKMKPVPEKVYLEHYDRFIRYPAWQVITSSAHNQEAFDVVANPDNVVLAEDKRGIVQNSSHSPFAMALIEGLQDDRADLIPDGVITANELITYVDLRVSELSQKRQNPGLYPLRREYDRGNFIFTRPEFKRNQLDLAPDLDESNNPYRGLKSFEEKDADFFFGRKASIGELEKRLSKTTLIIVQGISGSGKSSLVKAGLIPFLRKNQQEHWYILDSMRPGKLPFTSLARVLLPVVNESLLDRLPQISFLDEELKKLRDLDLASATQAKSDKDPQKKNLIKVAKLWDKATPEAKLLLVRDYFEDLTTIDIAKEKQQLLKNLYDEIWTTLEPLPNNFQQDSQYLIDRIDTWSKKHPDRKLLVVIDQFEELITASQESQTDTHATKLDRWQPFLQTLTKAIDACPNQWRVVLTLRSDFELRFRDSLLKKYWDERNSLFEVGPMNLDELREAIEKPADKQALLFEPPELVDKLIDEVVRMPGALPLLSFTLSELYIKLHDRWKEDPQTKRALLSKDYEDLGRLANALTRRAKDEYDKFLKDFGREEGKKYQAIMRRVMLRMMTIEGSAVAKRRVPESELCYPTDDENKHREEAIERLVGVRLVVKGQESGESYVEPAHDFLVQGWQTLPIWEERKNKEILSLQRRLTPAAGDWERVKNEENERPTTILDKTDPVLNWLDRRLLAVENSVNRIPAQFARLLRRDRDRQGRLREKPVQFLWAADPYLNVLDKELNSDDNWLNQIEAEFVQQSVLQKRRNLSWRWRIAIAVMLGLGTGLVFSLIGQRNALIGQIDASRQASEAKLQLGQDLEALTASLRAAKSLKDWPAYLSLFKPDNKLQPQVRATLQKVIYGVKERDRLKQDKGQMISGLSSDGRKLANLEQYGFDCFWDNLVCLWDKSGKQMAEFLGSQNERLKSIAFSPDRSKLITVSITVNSEGSGTDDSPLTLRLWDLKSNRHLAEFKGHDRDVWSVSFSPDGSKIAIAGDDGISLWDANGKQIPEFKGGQGRVADVVFSPDGTKLASAIDSTSSEGYQNVRLWNLKGQQVGQLKGDLIVDSVIFSPDGTQLATTGNGTTRLWNLSGERMGQLKASSVIFSPDGSLLAGLGEDGIPRVWDLSGDRLFELKGHQGRGFGKIFSPDGKQLVTTGDDNTIRLWDVNSKAIAKFEDKEKEYRETFNMVFSPDGSLVATEETSYENENDVDPRFDMGIGRDNAISLWDLQGKKLGEIPTNQGNLSVKNIAISPDNQQLAIVEGDDIARLWNWRNKQKLAQFPAPQGSSIIGVSFSGDRSLIVTKKNKGNTFLLLDWKGKQVTQFKDPQKQVNEVILSPNSSKILTAGNEGLRLWNLDGKQIAQVKVTLDDEYDDNKVILSRNDRSIAINEKEGISVWNWDGKQIAQFKGVHAMDFSPDGSLLATNQDLNNVVRLWDLERKQQVAEFSARADFAVQFSPNGKFLVTAGNSVPTLWRVESFDDLIVRGCDRVRDYLENNSSVAESDRHLCDDVPVLVTSQNSTTTPPPYPSTLTPEDFSPALQAMAEDYYTRGSEQPAKKLIAKYTQIIENPDSDNADTIADAYINRGVIYFRQRKYALAIQDYTEVINRIAPKKAAAYVNRGIAYSTQKDHEKAIEDYDEAIKIDPKNIDAYISRGIAYSSMANPSHEKAIEDYLKAIAINPDDADAYYAMGFTQTLMEGKRQEALENYQKAADLYQQQNKPKYAENARKKIEDLGAFKSSRSK